MSQDKKIDTLIDRFSRKEEVSIGINGYCDSQGILEQILPTTVRLNPDVTHKIALVSLETTSFFPNLTEKSNKFYYSYTVNRVVRDRVITLPSGMYEIKDYNNRIKKQMEVLGDDSKNITITLDDATGKNEIELKGGYKVDFTKDNTWRECLGFVNEKLEQDGVYVSAHVADIVPSQCAYVGCNLCKGSIEPRDKMLCSNVLFRFSTLKQFGMPLLVAPQVLRPRELMMKEFETVRLQFVDDDGKPINFMGAQVTGEIYIYQS